MEREKNTRQTQLDITNKIDDTQKQIELLKSNPEVNQSELTKIENEFDSWAKDFIANKDTKKLEI